MKRILLVLLSVILLAGCAKKRVEASAYAEKGTKPIKIVTTIFPIYDFTKNIVGTNSNFDIKMLIKSGIDMHSFNPSAADLKEIADCDLFIYIGGESDEWVHNAINSGLNKKMRTVNLMEKLPEILVEEDEDIMGEEEHEEEKEYDEHIWLSLNNAYGIVKVIRDELLDITKDENLQGSINENSKEYLDKIYQLEEAYRNSLNLDGNMVIVFADRFPFKYLCDDYKIKYFAAFKGCSAESEASFEKIKSLAKKVDEYNLDYVFTLEGNNKKLANTVIENTEKKNAKILTLDSMQSVTEKDVANGVNYLDIMDKNLDTLKISIGANQ